MMRYIGPKLTRRLAAWAFESGRKIENHEASGSNEWPGRCASGYAALTLCEHVKVSAKLLDEFLAANPDVKLGSVEGWSDRTGSYGDVAEIA